MPVVKIIAQDLERKYQEISATWFVRKCQVGRRSFSDFEEFYQLVRREKATGILDHDTILTLTVDYDLNQINVTKRFFTPIPDSILRGEDQDYSYSIIQNFSYFYQVTSDFEDSYFLRLSAFYGRTDAFRMFLEPLNPAADSSFALRTAAEQGFTEIVNLLLQDGRSDAKAMSNYALRAAAAHGHLEIVNLLLEYVDPTDDGAIVVEIAAHYHQYEVVKALLRDKRFDVNHTFQLAVGLEMPSLVEEIISRVELDVLEDSFITACQKNISSVVGTILTSGRISSEIKNLGMIKTIENCGVDSLLFLLQDGDVVASYDNNLPIRLAAQTKCSGVVALLLNEEDVDPTVNDNEPLRNALIGKDDDIIEELFNVVQDSIDRTSELYTQVSKIMEADTCVIDFDTIVKLKNAMTCCGKCVCSSCLMHMRSFECPACRQRMKGPLITEVVVASIQQNLSEDLEAARAQADLNAQLAAQGVSINERYGL